MALAVLIDFQFSATAALLVESTGNYNVTTNPGGYGAPNPAYADYAHYAIIRKKNVNMIADSVMAVNAYNPISATQWQATRSVDGWYEGVKLNILIWTAGTYPLDTVRYRSGVIYKVTNVAGTSNQPPHADWTVVSDLTSIETNASLVATTKERVTAFTADAVWSQLIADLTQQGNLAIPDDERDKKRLDDIERTIKQVLAADQLGNNAAGEWCVLRLQRLGAK